MKRLTLFAVLAATVLAWAAPAFAGTRLLYAKTDSIWGHIGVTGAAGNVLSGTTKFRHWIDSTGVNLYHQPGVSSCQRYWVEIVQLKNPDAAGGADTAATFAVQIRSRDGTYPTNDSLVVDYARRKNLWVDANSAATNPPLDSLTFQFPTIMGTDSTLAWCETGARTLPGGMYTVYSFAGAISGHTGVRIDFENGMTGQPWVPHNPEIKWRILSSSAAQVHPKLAWYRIRIYCSDGR